MTINRMLVFLRLAGIIIGLILIYFTLKYILILFYPFIIAFIFAYLLHPLISKIENKWKLPRILATLFILIIILSTTVSILVVFTSELIYGTLYLAENLPQHLQTFTDIAVQIFQERLIPFYEHITSFFKSLHPSQQSIIVENIETIISRIGTSISLFLHKALITIGKFISFIPQSITVGIFIMIATFLFAKDFSHIEVWIRKKLPYSARKSTIRILIHLRKLLIRYFKAQFIIILFTAIVILIGLLIIGMEHAFTIALLTAIIDILPFIGTGTIFIPWIFYLFLKGKYLLTIKITILYMFVVILRQIIEPKILSEQLGVRPIVTLLILFIAYQIWGIAGIIIAPFIIVFYSALQQTGLIRQLINFITG